jgi:hypothetical protein
MTATTSSSSSHNQTRPNDLASPITTGPPGPEVIAEALPFDTIPAEVLWDHFTKWLVESLAQSELQAAEPPQFPPGVEPAPKPKRPKAKSRPPGRKREGPPSDAMEPPPPSTPALSPLPPPPALVSEPEPEHEPGSVSTTTPSPAAAAHVRASRTPDPETALPARPQYVRLGDKSVWLTKPMLRSRGWTEAAIRDFLPGPEALKPNPRFAVSGAPMPVWRPETVARAEADPKWRAWLERSLQRRQTTLEALAATDDREFRTRLELADQAIRDCTAPPALLDTFDREETLTTSGSGH